MGIKSYIYNHEPLKRFVHGLIMHPVRTRPRWYIRLLQFLYVKRGRRSVIYSSVRRDLVPFRVCRIGANTVIESFSVLNNAVGDLIIGDDSRVGVGNTIIGPVTIGDHVHIGQHVLISGLNHNYEDIHVTITDQGVRVAPIIISENVWIGANAVVLPGVSIGQHAVVGAGSVVTKDVAPYTVVAGNPARVIKQWDDKQSKWIKHGTT